MKPLFFAKDAMFRALPLRIGVLTTMFVYCSVSLAEPRYISDLAAKGFLSSPVINGATVTLTAGSRFTDLVPDSQRELCELQRAYYAKAAVSAVRILSASGQVLMTCGS